MKKLAMVLFALPLAFAAVPASAAKRGETCYVVHQRGIYGRSGKPVRQCPANVGRRNFRVVGPPRFGYVKRCVGKPSGYRFVQVVQGRPRLITCNVRRVASGLVRPKLRRLRR